VDFKDGDEVKKDASLFEIDPRPYKVDLDRAAGSAAQIEARLARLDAERRRVVTLFNRGASSREEFDRSTGDYKEAQASLSVARANLDMAKLNIEFTKVRAPIGGLLSRRLVDPGNLVQADVTPLTSSRERWCRSWRPWPARRASRTRGSSTSATTRSTREQARSGSAV
jgi:multidrug efflux system membrane fusion protein